MRSIMLDKMTQELLQAVGLANKDLAARSETMQSIVAENAQLAKDVLVAQETAGENTIAVLKAKELAELKAQQDTLKYATTLGTNPDSASQILTTLGEEWKVSAVDAAGKRKKLQEAVDKNVFEDPAGWFKAQFQMEDLIKQADAATARRADVQNALQFAQTQTQQAAATSSALAQTKTEATVQASLAAATATLQQNLATTKLQNSSINIQGIDRLNSMTLAQINNLSTGVSVMNQQEQLRISRENLANTTLSLQSTLQERADRIAQKQEDRAELEGLADLVRKGAAVMGFKDVAAFPTAKITQLLNLKQANVQDFLMAGMQSSVSGTPVISDNPGNTARMLIQHSAPLRPEQAPIKAFFTDVWSKAASPEGGLVGKYDNTKLDQVTRAATQFAGQAAKDQMVDIKTGDSTNIYAPPTLQAVAAVPAIANSALFKNVLATQLAAGGLKEFNPDQLISLTVDAIQKGAVTYNEGAEGLQGMFGTARSINNVSKNYVGFGLPPQTGYRTRVTNGLGFSRSVDLTTAQDINNILNSKLSRFNQAAKPVIDSRPFTIN